MNKRRWSEPVSAEAAESHFQRFVSHVTRRETADRTKPLRGDDRTPVIYPSAEDIEKSRLSRPYPDEPVGNLLDAGSRRRFLIELDALYRHGHLADVTAEVERVLQAHAEDVELRERLADFFLERDDVARTTELLFDAVALHLEKTNPRAARRCLERVQQLDPANQRLRRYDALLAES